MHTAISREPRRLSFAYYYTTTLLRTIKHEYIYDIYLCMFTMWEQVKHARTISLIVDGEEYEEFRKLLPNGKTFGQYIRKVMREEIELQKKEEGLNSPNYSAVSRLVSNNNKQSTLDIFFPQHIIEWSQFKNIIDKLEDKEREELTAIWLHDFRILEGMNMNKKGRKVFPFVKA